MPSQDQPWPIPTRFSTFTPLIDPDRVGKQLADGYGPVLHQKLMLLWGKATPLLICPDTWLLEMKESKEEEAKIELSWTRVSCTDYYGMGTLLNVFGEFCCLFSPCVHAVVYSPKTSLVAHCKASLQAKLHRV